MIDYSDYELDILTDPLHDSWTEDSFEDALTMALCSGFETKLSAYSKVGNKAVLVNKEKLQEINRFGSFLPVDEVYRLPGNFGKFIDYLKNSFPIDGDFAHLLPKRACLTLTNAEKGLDQKDEDSFFFNTYATTYYIEKTQSPKYYNIPDGETAYFIYFIYYKNDGTVDALKHVVSIDKNFCVAHVPSNLSRSYEPDPEIDMPIVDTFNLVCMNWIERKLSPRFYVVAKENQIMTRFSVLHSQAKSLFYSRELQPTKNGRQKPILHWVQSHKRRIKEGIEIDISKHLRGVNSFELFGLEMSILCPEKSIAIQKAPLFKGFSKSLK